MKPKLHTKLCSFILFLFFNIIFSQQICPIEKLAELQKKEPKISIIYIYTDWCTYCKQMKQTTFKSKEVKEILDEKFYFSILDAEDKKDILFAGKIFSFKPTGINTGIHELAKELTFSNKTKNTESYPYLVFFNSSNEIIFQHSGFLNAIELLHILQKASELK